MEQKIKLVAIDMDGTLLNSNKIITEETKKVIEKAVSEGVYIVPATGRTIKGLPEYLAKSPDIRYGIFSNGAVVMDIKEEKVLYTDYLDIQLTNKLIEVAMKYDVMCDVYIDGMGYCEKRCLTYLDYYNVNPYLKQLVLSTRIPQDDLVGFLKERKEPVEKINIFFHDLEEREVAMQEFKELGICRVVSSLFNNIELNTLTCSKGNSMLHLASYLDIKQEETMAIGDADNDYEMIRLAGMGVAMDNALDEIKEVANHVTLSNDLDGVAEAIKKFAIK